MISITNIQCVVNHISKHSNFSCNGVLYVAHMCPHSYVVLQINKTKTIRHV